MDFILLAVLAVTVIVAFFWIRRGTTEGFHQQFQLVTSTPDAPSLKPRLWWFCDDETNARHWWDFGARNSRQPNRGYLQVALEAVYATQGFDFDVQPLIGRAAVSKVLRAEGVDLPADIYQLPATLWRAWAFHTLLANKGGLVMVGDSTLCVGSSFATRTNGTEAAMFGMTSDEPRATPGFPTAPAMWVGWAAKPHAPVWDVAAIAWSRLVHAGPTGWTAAEARRMHMEIWTMQRTKISAVFQDAEGSRLADGKERTMEDLLMRVSNPVDPKTALSPAVLYVPMDGDILVRHYKYSWFVRMSKKQILEEGDFVWADLARRHRSRLFKAPAGL